MRLAVIGSKDFNDYQKLVSILNQISGITTIVSGAAQGTDTMAARYAREHNLKLMEFPPDFKKNREEAKHIRNPKIVENCDNLVAFWTDKCEGTKCTLNFAKKLNIPIKKIMI
ncbi:MAG: DUF2493 domain-containing protein [Candidatus Cloacimonetes bacterium]|nr:DUF2493 domain-containing protein [Candidatus Cloacimonadota bacterium]